MDYRTAPGEMILVKVGLSYVGVEGARNNLNAEIPDWDFNWIKEEAEETWNREIAKIHVKGRSEEQKHIFNTALYHSLLTQFISSDNDGKYFGMDGNIQVADDNDFFPSFFCWDTLPFPASANDTGGTWTCQ